MLQMNFCIKGFLCMHKICYTMVQKEKGGAYMEQYQKAVALWRYYNVTTAADLDKYLDSFRLLFAYHSGRIENQEITYNDTREIFENGKVQA